MNILLNVLYINNVHIQANCFDFHLILGGVFALKKFEMFEQCNTLICFDQKRYFGRCSTFDGNLGHIVVIGN